MGCILSLARSRAAVVETQLSTGHLSDERGNEETTGASPHDAIDGEQAAASFIEPSSIFALLEPVVPGGLPPVRLLDSAWLLERALKLEAAATDAEREALAVPCRQDLERLHPEAFLSVEQCRALAVHDQAHGYWQPTGALAIGSVSHAWLEPHHPDRHGRQLVKLASILRAAQRKQLPRQQTGWDAKAPRRHGYVQLPAQCGLFYDWASLCQAQKAADGSVLVERTSAERAAFSHAINCMQLWYAHQKLFAVLLTELPDGCTAPPYDARGWPTVERAWTMLAKPNNMSCWPMVYEVGRSSGEATRTAPMHPDRLDRLLESKRFTSAKADRPLVSRLYRETCTLVLGEATKLSFGESGWSDYDIVSFSEVLPLSMRCQKLNLGRNACGDTGASALAWAADCGAALRLLTVLALNDNAIGELGCEAIAEAALRGAFPQLRHLFLMNNRIGSQGTSALARALHAGALPELLELHLHGNPATGITAPLCRFWSSGKCNKGAECGFRHGAPPAKPATWQELERVCQARRPKVALWREPGGAQ